MKVLIIDRKEENRIVEALVKELFSMDISASACLTLNPEEVITELQKLLEFFPDVIIIGDGTKGLPEERREMEKIGVTQVMPKIADFLYRNKIDFFPFEKDGGRVVLLLAHYSFGPVQIVQDAMAWGAYGDIFKNDIMKGNFIPLRETINHLRKG